MPLRIKSIPWVVCLLAYGGHAAWAGERLVRLATGELPPYATQDRPDQGMALDIVRRAFAEEGYRVEYTFLPWSRALHEAKSGKWDGTAYWGYTKERARDFLLSENIITEQWVLLHRADSPFDWHQWADLKPYVMATVPNYTYTPELWALVRAGAIRNDPSPNDLSSLRKLVAGRVDLVPLDRRVACYLMNRYMPDQVNRIAAHPRLIAQTFTTHLMLNRQNKDNLQRLMDFNRGLRKLKAADELDHRMGQATCFDAAGMHPMSSTLHHEIGHTS